MYVERRNDAVDRVEGLTVVNIHFCPTNGLLVQTTVSKRAIVQQKISILSVAPVSVHRVFWRAFQQNVWGLEISASENTVSFFRSETWVVEFIKMFER